MTYSTVTYITQAANAKPCELYYDWYENSAFGWGFDKHETQLTNQDSFVRQLEGHLGLTSLNLVHLNNFSSELIKKISLLLKRNQAIVDAKTHAQAYLALTKYNALYQESFGVLITLGDEEKKQLACASDRTLYELAVFEYAARPAILQKYLDSYSDDPLPELVLEDVQNAKQQIERMSNPQYSYEKLFGKPAGAVEQMKKAVQLSCAYRETIKVGCG